MAAILHKTLFTIRPERRECVPLCGISGTEVIARHFDISCLFLLLGPYTNQGGGNPQHSAGYPSPMQPVAQGVYAPQVQRGMKQI